MALARVESQGGGKRLAAGPGAQSQEMRVRSLLSTLESFEFQRPAFTREGDVYPEKRLNRARVTKKHMLVEEHGGGMLKAIPGGSAGAWTAGVILKLAGSEEARYYENVVRPGVRRAPSAASACTSASRSRSAPDQPSKSKSKEDAPAHRCIAGIPISTRVGGKEDYGDPSATPAAKRVKKPMGKPAVLEAMAALSKPLSRAELFVAMGGAPPEQAAQPTSRSAAPTKAPLAPFVCTHVSERGRTEAASKGAYFAGYSFAG